MADQGKEGPPARAAGQDKLSQVSHKAWLEKAHTLVEALPYMQQYEGQTVVIKYGGSAMGDPELAQDFARAVALIRQIGMRPIVVHGGGPQIGAMLERLKIKSSFIDGLRVTDKETVEVVEMVLAGTINKQIVSDISRAGGRAVGLSGKDSNLIIARRLHRTTRDPESNIEKVLDLGFVGEPESINAEILTGMGDAGVIPVIAPVGISKGGETYNINADTVAGAIAGAVNAKRLLLLTDVPGVLDEEGHLLTNLSINDTHGLIQQGTIAGGMIPKVETCMTAIEQGVEAVVILDGRVPHAILLELFTDLGAGTLIKS